jgi:hypothetical protein
MRYAVTDILKTSTQKRRYATTILPVIPVSANDTYIQVTNAERLDVLANQFYGDISLWWVIATANGIGKGSIIVPQNTKLRIPAKTDIMSLLIQKNSIR